MGLVKLDELRERGELTMGSPQYESRDDQPRVSDRVMGLGLFPTSIDGGTVKYSKEISIGREHLDPCSVHEQINNIKDRKIV